MTVTVTVTVPNYIEADCLGCDEELRQPSLKSLYERYFFVSVLPRVLERSEGFYPTAAENPIKYRTQPDSIFNHRIIYFRYPAGFCSEASDCRKGQVVARNYQLC